MDIKKIIELAKKQKWSKGSTWEFDLYIDHIFVEAMAYGSYPVAINYFQPIIDDEFLNTNLNDNLLNKFEFFFENKKELLKLIHNQKQIIEAAKTLLSTLKTERGNLNFEEYAKVQYDLSILMASVSVVFDPLISDHLKLLESTTEVRLEDLSSFIIYKSGVTALNKSNDALLKIYNNNKGEFDSYLNNKIPLPKKIKDLLKDHSKEFGWINTGEKGRSPWNIDDFIEQLINIKDLDNKENITLPVKLESDLKEIVELNINDNIAADIQIELDFEFQKFLQHKLGKNYEEDVIENITLDEIKKIVINPGQINNYTNRKDSHKLIYADRGKAHVIWLNNKDLNELSKVVQENTKVDASTNIVGRPACIGLVEGIARVVRNQQDLLNFEKGFVLVAEKTQPSYVMAMKKAIAIVTDIGGVTSHAAIVSRELNIPCIVATGNATSIIHDGDLIRVDAEKGTVEILKRFKSN